MAIYRQLTLCSRIRGLRESAGLTQSEVADELCISQAAYSRFEKGDIEMSVTKLLELCDMFGVTLALLVEGL
jgi:transcriptional regulator with XRE-family HTH domain